MWHLSNETHRVMAVLDLTVQRASLRDATHSSKKGVKLLGPHTDSIKEGQSLLTPCSSLTCPFFPFPLVPLLGKSHLS